ncbi:aromatic-ring-hydroxylating dioxygenase subunit beta [Streptomyces sp. NPDC001732]
MLTSCGGIPDWPEFLADDARYEAPVARAGLAGRERAPTSRIFDDTKQTREVRIRRLGTDFAWTEQPPSRTRHHITDVIVDAAVPPDSGRTSSPRTASCSAAGATRPHSACCRCSVRTRSAGPGPDGGRPAEGRHRASRWSKSTTWPISSVRESRRRRAGGHDGVAP